MSDRIARSASLRLRGAAVALALLGVACAPRESDAQEWQTVSSSRRYAGEKNLRVDIEYGAGQLRIRPAAKGTLYRSALRYDARVYKPVTEFAGGRLHLGIDGKKDVKIRNMDSHSRMEVALGSDAPLDLQLNFGAVEARIDLGGLAIHSLELSTGASDTELRFSRPNPLPLDQMELKAGAAAFKVYGIGNANAEDFRFSGGVGDILLDFTGNWQRDMDAELELGLGSLTLVLPEDVGVEIRKETFLVSFDSDRMTKRGSAYYSSNWGRAARKLTIQLEGALGSIDLRWGAAAAAAAR